MHSNKLKACLVMFGCSKNIVHIIDMITFLLKSPNFFELIRYSKTQIKTNMIINAMGKNMVRNTLKISVDGVKNFISVSSTNQSNDKKASEDEPNISTDPNISIKLSGNLRLNEYAAAISCK